MAVVATDGPPAPSRRGSAVLPVVPPLTSRLQRRPFQLISAVGTGTCESSLLVGRGPAALALLHQGERNSDGSGDVGHRRRDSSPASPGGCRRAIRRRRRVTPCSRAWVSWATSYSSTARNQARWCGSSGPKCSDGLFVLGAGRLRPSKAGEQAGSVHCRCLSGNVGVSLVTPRRHGAD